MDHGGKLRNQDHEQRAVVAAMRAWKDVRDEVKWQIERPKRFRGSCRSSRRAPPYVVLHPPRLAVFARAGEAMLAVYGLYGLIVLATLGYYAALGWRKRYLASAVILGPLTWLRPAVAVAGATLGGVASPDPLIWACAGLAVAAVLSVEPLAGRLWYAAARPSRPGRAACWRTSWPHRTQLPAGSHPPRRGIVRRSSRRSRTRSAPMP